MRRATALLLFGFVFAGAAQASDMACQGATATPRGRPAIGLVLSGGGARGYAHLGVLKVLEENRIPVDCIAASSMGAVVGGLYASGMTAQDMEHRLAQVNLADIAFDVTPRADLPQSQREDERLYVNNLAFGFGARGFRLPAGLVQGSQLQALLQAWIGAAPSNLSFDALPIPYRAIATDLQTGDEVVLDHGSLPQVIRASMALPGLFAPTDVDGRTLVDGGLVDNLPVSTARALGADVVIAVDIGSPLRSLDALASPADVMQQMLGILIHQNVARERGRLGANDVLISPALGPLSFTDFAHADQAIAAGEAAARAALPRLRQLALSPEQYAAWRAQHTAPTATPLRVTRIDIRSRGVVPPQRISEALHVHAGDVYDPAAVNKDLLALSTTGDFDTVTQRLVTNGDEHTLVIDARDRDWGPNFLLFGLGVSSSSSDEGNFRAHLGYRRPWLTSSGLEGRVDATVGSDLTSFHAELRQPLSNALGYYVAPYVDYQHRYINLYDESGAVKVTQFAQQSERAGLDFGIPLARLGDFRIGVAYAHGTSVPQYNLPFGLFFPEFFPSDFRLLPDLSGEALALRARLVIDQLDDPVFPRQGYFTEVRAERSIFGRSHSHVDGNQDDHASYVEVYGKSIGAASYGRQSLNVSVEGGSDFGRANPVDPFGFSLGGFQHLSAYAADQLAGDAMVYAQLTYMNQLANFNASPIRSLFAGVSLEVGNVWNSGAPDGSNGPLKKDISFFTSATTAFGPIYLGVAFAPAGRINFYFQLGRTY